MSEPESGTKQLEMKLRVAKADLPAAPPYANATHTFASNKTDLTIAFLRMPILLQEDIARLASGETDVDAHVVASVTLPRSVAVSLALRLIEMLGAPTEIVGEK